MNEWMASGEDGTQDLEDNSYLLAVLFTALVSKFHFITKQISVGCSTVFLCRLTNSWDKCQQNNEQSTHQIVLQSWIVDHQSTVDAKVHTSLDWFSCLIALTLNMELGRTQTSLFSHVKSSVSFFFPKNLNLQKVMFHLVFTAF